MRFWFLFRLARNVATMSLLAGVVFMASCSGGVIGHVDVEQAFPSVTVQGNATGGLLPPSFASFTVDVTQEPSYQNGDFDFAKTIQLDSLMLTITSDSEGATDNIEDGSPDNFDFVDSMQIYVMGTFNGQSEEVLVASLATGDPQLNSQRRNIVLEMTGADILGFVEAPGGYQVQVRASGNLPPDDVIFNGRAVYRVGVGFS